ncbi:MAG: GlsB/YeaQ/YmgE family stress response membrane protein [Rhodoglobus sp.]|nr:GlsB/YeaQ/YmgE family stress response membrane protein [Rhodoglobus sp.]
MSIIGWIILGLAAGAIAKAILPGTQGGGWIITLILGVVGALLGGFIGSAVFGIGLEGFFSLETWLLAIGGSVLVLLIFGLVTRGARRV